VSAGSPSTSPGCTAATAQRPKRAGSSARYPPEERRSRSHASCASIESAPWRQRSPRRTDTEQDYAEAFEGQGSSSTACGSRDHPVSGKSYLSPQSKYKGRKPEPTSARRPKPEVKPKGTAILVGQGSSQKRAWKSPSGKTYAWRKTKRGKAINRSTQSKQDRVIKGALCRAFGSEFGKAESKIVKLRRKLAVRFSTAPKSKAYKDKYGTAPKSKVQPKTSRKRKPQPPAKPPPPPRQPQQPAEPPAEPSYSNWTPEELEAIGAEFLGRKHVIC
jgi:hypothetical protein